MWDCSLNTSFPITGGLTCLNGGTCTPSGDCCCPSETAGNRCEITSGTCTATQDVNAFIDDSRMCTGVWTCVNGLKECSNGFMVSFYNFQRQNG